MGWRVRARDDWDAGLWLGCLPPMLGGILWWPVFVASLLLSTPYPTPYSLLPTSCSSHPYSLSATPYQLRASYCAQDHNDEPTAAHSLAFAGEDSRLFAGYEHAIRAFDLSRPGHNADVLRTTPTRRSKQGQKGIISALCAVGTDTLAAASFRGTVWLYDTTRLGLRPVRSLGTAHAKGATCVAATADGACMASGARAGKNKGVWRGCLPRTRPYSRAPTRPFLAGGRLDDSVHVWDMRQTQQRLCSVPRAARTNQRLGFVFAPDGTLWMGDGNGHLCGWSVRDGPPQCVASTRLHECVNGVDVSNSAPTRLVVSTGERVFHCPDSDSEEEGDAGGLGSGPRGTLTTLHVPAVEA